MPDYSARVVTNRSEIYERIFELRGVKSITHYGTKTFEKLDKMKLRVMNHNWSYGDTLHKLALSYYGSPKNWWKIGLVNGKPTDAHYNIGDKVFIPVDPESIRV